MPLRKAVRILSPGRVVQVTYTVQDGVRKRSRSLPGHQRIRKRLHSEVRECSKTLTPKDEKDTDRDSSLEVGLMVDSPGEEATGKDDPHVSPLAWRSPCQDVLCTCWSRTMYWRL
jgi:hypothetical protein